MAFADADPTMSNQAQRFLGNPTAGGTHLAKLFAPASMRSTSSGTGGAGRALLPLTLLPAPRGSQGTWAFETPAEVDPRVRATLEQRPAKKGDTRGEWEVTLTAEDTLIDAATGCTEAPRPSTRLTTQLTLHDGTHVPVVMHTMQSWRCGKHRLKAS